MDINNVKVHCPPAWKICDESFIPTNSSDEYYIAPQMPDFENVASSCCNTFAILTILIHFYLT